MSLSVLTNVQTLNFILVGQARSGMSVVQSSLDGHSSIVCHVDLLHDNEAHRRAMHEGYFGVSPEADRLPDWWTTGISPYQYMAHHVFDNPRNGERVVGMQVSYSQTARLELYDFFEERSKEGDFCLIHLRRNPVACFTSLKQAQRSGIFNVHWASSLLPKSPPPISLDPVELAAFVRSDASICGKIRATSRDILEITYKDLFTDYRKVVRNLFEFLEVPTRCRPMPRYRRLPNRPIRDRIANFNQLRAESSNDVRRLLDSEDLF